MDMGASWRGVWGYKGFGGDVIGKQYGRRQERQYSIGRQ
jgi:hypothetical protein